MPLNWGILTAGNIAQSFAAGLKASRTGRLVAVGARDLERARAFAEQWGGVGYGTYEEVLHDPSVQAIYIATPHHLHAKWTIEAARAGKAVLCEKPFTIHAAEAEEAISEVRKSGVFFMEAFMYRCSPQTRKLMDLIHAGTIGRVRAVSATFSFGSSPHWRNFRTDPNLGGGGLLDVGTYCSSFALLVTGEEPDRAEFAADLTLGYDAYGAGCLHFPSGAVASIASGVHLPMRNDAMVYGDKGWIHVQDPWKSGPDSVMTVTRYAQGSNGDETSKRGVSLRSRPEVYRLGFDGHWLYAHEADAVSDFLDQGECPYMPIDETLANMRCLDRLRRSCGLTGAP